MPNGSDRVTCNLPQELQPTKSVDNEPEIKAWLALGTKTKKKGGGKKKKGNLNEQSKGYNLTSIAYLLICINVYFMYYDYDLSL